MSSTENARPAGSGSVPRIDLTKAFNNKKNKNKTPSNPRKPMGNLNRLSGTATPLGLLSPPASQTNVLAGSFGSDLDLDQRSEPGLRGREVTREREEDPARLLISPPPEEELQLANLSRRSGLSNSSTSHSNNTNAPPFTDQSQPKRKRSMVSTPSYTGASSYFNVNPEIITARGSESQATPNPKPRKQSRKYNRAHVRTNSNQSDVSMESVPSPSRVSRAKPSSWDDQSPSTPSRGPRQSNLMKSPHSNNPNADYIPLYRPAPDGEVDDWPISPSKPVRLSRRSATPAAIPPYEPPPLKFPPPREVTRSPVASATKSKRKAGARRLKVDVQVKPEPPEIDLSAPMPPASPTDDPLLLSGPPGEDLTPPFPRVMRDASVSADMPQKSAAPHFPLIQPQASLPPSSPPPPDASSPSHATYHWSDMGIVSAFDSSSDNSMELDMQPHEYDEAEGGIPDFFGVNGFTAVDEWSDSDDEESPRTPQRKSGVIDEGIGEFTGHWQMTKTRTKADPPSSATRTRIEIWGNPKSPYPYTTPRTSRDGSASPSPSHSRLGPETGRLSTSTPPEEMGTVTVFATEERHVQAMGEDSGLSAEVSVAIIQASEEEEEQEVRYLSLPPADEEGLADQQEVPPEDTEKMSRTAEEGEDEGFALPEEERAEEELAEEEEAEEEEVRRLSLGPEERSHHDGPFNALSIVNPPAQSSPAPRRDLTFLSEPFNRKRSSARVSASFERAKQLFGTCPSPLKASSPVPEEVGDDDDDHSMEPLPVPFTTSDKKQEARDLGEDPGEEDEEVISLREDADSGEESDPVVEDPGLVQITSSDPRAAARAAAILKQHDYDCYTRILLKQQQQHRRDLLSYPSVEELKRTNRRKTLADAGISKGNARHILRRSLGTVIGDKVYIPGSPMMTLGGLLEAAEKEVQLEQSKGLTPGAQNFPPALSAKRNTLAEMALEDTSAYRTPLSAKYGIVSWPSSALMNEVGEEEEEPSIARREWMKDDWKVLDGCFTDERIELARTHSDALISTIGDEEIPLAEVELVQIDKVIERFITEMGGADFIHTCGWTMESLRARVKTLQKKQRAGNVAPPITPYTTPTMTKIPRPQSTSMDIPNFTPFGRRPFPAARKSALLPTSPLPINPSAPFSHISEDLVEPRRRRKVPATLLAPRYSHLLEEAVAVSRDLPDPEPREVTSQDVEDSRDDASAAFLDQPSFSLDLSTSDSTLHNIQRSGFGRLFSYLPGFSKTPAPSTRKTFVGAKPGLPLPPTEVLEKPRAPVITPARPPVPKMQAPKELVSLNHQPIPQKKSMIPRRDPKRMKELKKVGLPEERGQVGAPSVRPRRSSGSSVKDLIKGFEDNDRRASLEASRPSLMKTRSNGDLKGGEKTSSRPIWRP
ncbi:hypothetical protein D9757_002374 [Collybiopsis confluens]|uniref:Uncharacterized protein n=1 Tax=Collybiopsis confluens TaxID=2823264 RepID=A0A8H5MFC6_9AGAR|nr:hypothetical protein D9757_002374 [Collybiopsis confluens]